MVPENKGHDGAGLKVDGHGFCFEVVFLLSMLT